MIPVGVVTATKNYGKYLPVAIESLRAQSYPHWDLIVIDDGSTDDTEKVIRPYLQDARVRYVQSDRLGQSRAKNLGIGLARGELLAFLDADDAWLPTKLEKQVALFQEKPEVGVVFTRRSLIDESGQPMAKKSPDATPPRGKVTEAIFQKNFICFSSVMIRRSVLELVGRFEPEWDLSIDYDLWLRAAPQTEFDFVDEELVLYRTGHGNLSGKLADRVATADSIMLRATGRRRLDVSAPLIAEGFASTYRALAYTLREVEPQSALRWYLRALRRSGGTREEVKGILVCLWNLLRGPRGSLSPENAAANR